MDCDSIGTIENNVFLTLTLYAFLLTLTLHALSMGIELVLCTLQGIENKWEATQCMMGRLLNKLFTVNHQVYL